MSEEPIAELNQGLQVFATEILHDKTAAARLELAVVSFGSTAKLERPFALISENEMPTLSVHGSTNLEDGMALAFQQLEQRKQYYRAQKATYYRPYIILITDGAPDKDPENSGLIAKLREQTAANKYSFWPIGVAGADMELLGKMACPGGGNLPAMQLEGLNFDKLFKWLSASFTKISNSHPGDMVDIAPTADNNPFRLTVS
jgi:uncharacterized protein YegL